MRSNQDQRFSDLAGAQCAVNGTVADGMWDEARLQGGNFLDLVSFSEVKFHERGLFYSFFSGYFFITPSILERALNTDPLVNNLSLNRG